MPNGGKKAVFPTLELHSHDPRAAANDHDKRTKKMLHQNSRSRSESKDSPDTEKVEHPQFHTEKVKQPKHSKTTEKEKEHKSEAKEK